LLLLFYLIYLLGQRKHGALPIGLGISLFHLVRLYVGSYLKAFILFSDSGVNFIVYSVLYEVLMSVYLVSTILQNSTSLLSVAIFLTIQSLLVRAQKVQNKKMEFQYRFRINYSYPQQSFLSSDIYLEDQQPNLYPTTSFSIQFEKKSEDLPQSAPELKDCEEALEEQQSTGSTSELSDEDEDFSEQTPLVIDSVKHSPIECCEVSYTLLVFGSLERLFMFANCFL